MTSTCSYNPVGGIPKDGSFASGLRSKTVTGCVGRFATMEANSALINDTLTVKDVVDASNVLYYGADPTGTTDSTVAFQAALAAGRCSVYVPFGTYLITATLAVPAGLSVRGECERGSIVNFVNNTAQFDAFTLAANSSLTNLSITYGGTNSATTTAVSVLGSNVQLRAVHMTVGATQMAWGVGFDAAGSNAVITNSTIHGVLIGIRFTAAFGNVRIADNILSAGTAGTVVNTTTSSGQVVLMGNQISAAGASTGINAAVAVTAIGNVYSVTTPLAGAALLTSTLHESITNDTAPTSVNTTGAYSVDGIKVVGNQIGNWTTTTGASVPARTLATGDNTAAQLTNAFKQLLADLNSHGLLAVAITP
jgi:hypothetical protein